MVGITKGILAPPWDRLWELIQQYGEACRADEISGGGDPGDVELREAELKVATLRLERQIQSMRKE